MTSYDLVVTRADEEVARLYVEARAAGLEVSHYSTLKCRVFDGSPEPNVALGVFRLVGSLIFHKQDRRWEVRARADANAVDLSTLILGGLGVVQRHGRTPGHWTRTRAFKHGVSKRTGKPIATAGICYRLEAEDLLGASTAVSEPEATDDDLHRLLVQSTQP